MTRIPLDTKSTCGTPDGAHAPDAALGEIFTDEPEVILACLENTGAGSPPSASAVYRTALRAVHEHPTRADLLYCTARAAAEARELETAVQLLDRAIKVNPTYRDALVLAARIAHDRGQAASARVYADRALDAGADYPDVHTLSGRIWENAGDSYRARAAYRRALELNPNLPDTRAAMNALEESRQQP